jgi:hypothetical protein
VNLDQLVRAIQEELGVNVDGNAGPGDLDSDLQSDPSKPEHESSVEQKGG